MQTTTPLNSSFDALNAAFQKSQNILLLSHVRPDGDAIGSQIALGHSLHTLGKKVTLLNEDGLPENLSFLPWSEKIASPSEKYATENFDLVIALDTGNKPRLGKNCLAIAEKTSLWVNIDHHISNPAYGNLNYIDPHSPATGQILYQLITEQKLPLTPVTRDNIFIGVSTDTGSFQYAGTTKETFLMVADLLQQGLDLTALSTACYDENPYRKTLLLRELLNTLQRTNDGRIAHWTLTRATVEKLDLQPEDSEGLIDHLRSIQGVEAALFFEELSDQKIRVSARSKTDAINVSEVCQQFNGGGHKRAAGARIEGPLAKVQKEFLTAIEKNLSASS